MVNINYMEKLERVGGTSILGKEVSVYGTFEEPLFLAKDVAEWIEHSQSDVMIKMVDESERLTLTIFSSGQNREMWFLTEYGLYEVLMQSRKPIAKAFKSQVKAYLKELRTKGITATPAKIEEILSDPDVLINALTQLKAERAKSALLDEITQHQAKELKESAPKVEYFDKVMQSEALIPTNVIAKELGMSAVTLNLKLKERGILYKSGDTWVLYHQHQNKGYTGTKTASFTDSKGNTQSHVHTYWTEKGRKFIHDVMAKSVRLEPCRSHENN